MRATSCRPPLSPNRATEAFLSAIHPSAPSLAGTKGRRAAIGPIRSTSCGSSLPCHDVASVAGSSCAMVVSGTARGGKHTDSPKTQIRPTESTHRGPARRGRPTHARGEPGRLCTRPPRGPRAPGGNRRANGVAASLSRGERAEQQCLRVRTRCRHRRSTPTEAGHTRGARSGPRHASNKTVSGHRCHVAFPSTPTLPNHEPCDATDPNVTLETGTMEPVEISSGPYDTGHEGLVPVVLQSDRA